jgi:hypothetical protein
MLSHHHYCCSLIIETPDKVESFEDLKKKMFLKLFEVDVQFHNPTLQDLDFRK